MLDSILVMGILDKALSEVAAEYDKKSEDLYGSHEKAMAAAVVSEAFEDLRKLLKEM